MNKRYEHVEEVKDLLDAPHSAMVGINLKNGSTKITPCGTPGMKVLSFFRRSVTA